MKKKVYLICNAHLDPVWLWRWTEGCTEALSTFRTAAKLLDEYPEFVFNHNEALLYEWVLENDPDLFEDIRKKVAQGRWHIMGGWYLQPDCTMPAGESFVRNIERGRRFFSRHFGVKPTTAVNFDSFGHSKGLVQILNKSGYDSYIVCRAGKASRGPQDFIWEGFNGARINVHRSDENYNSVLGHAAEELRAFLERKSDESATLFLWGVGDHGGGPSRKDLSDLAVLMAEDEKHEITHTIPEAYFKEAVEGAKQGREIFTSGLNPVAEGCYTSQIRVKQQHRMLENALYQAEKLLSSAELQLGLPYPREELETAERDLIFGEFHDALPGSGEQPVEEDTLRLYGHGLEILDRLTTRAMIAMGAGLAPSPAGASTVLLYNPHPFDAKDTFAFECSLPAQNWDDNFLYPQAYLNGEPIPTQCMRERGHFAIDWRKSVVIRANLPAASMSRVDVRFHPIEKRPEYEKIANRRFFEFDNTEKCPENPMKVRINTSTGLIDSVSVGEREILTPESFRLDAFDDTFNPWGIGDRERHARRSFRLMTEYEASEFSGLRYLTPPIRVIEDGEIATVVEALFTCNRSNAYIRYTLSKFEPRIDVELGVYWNERDTTLRLRLNTAMENGRYLCQTVYGTEEADLRRETVAQKWSALAADDLALSVMGNGSYGGRFSGSSLELTILRSAAYGAAHCGRRRAVEDLRYFERMEQGERIFNYRFDFGRPETVLSGISNRALLQNEGPIALAYNPPGSGSGNPDCLILIDNPAVVLSCFKKSRDREGYIIRIYESDGAEQKCTLSLPFCDLHKAYSLSPYEIVTLYFDPRSGSLRHTDLIECD